MDQTQPAKPRAPYTVGRDKIQWPRLLPTAALVVISVGALQLVMSSNGSVQSQPAPVEAGSAATGNDSALGLKVTSSPHQLEIRWNRGSAAIAASDKGVMRITDDGVTEVVPFDQDQLHDGYVAYTPKTNDVSIRLEVTAKDGGTTMESVRSVAIP